MAMKVDFTKLSPNQLPLTGLKRASEILKYLPFGKTTLWEWSKDGRFPAPIRLNNKITCWRCEDVHMWLATHGKAPHAETYTTEVGL